MFAVNLHIVVNFHFLVYLATIHYFLLHSFSAIQADHHISSNIRTESGSQGMQKNLENSLILTEKEKRGMKYSCPYFSQFSL